VKALAQIHAERVIHKNIQPASLVHDRATDQVHFTALQLASELSREDLRAIQNLSASDGVVELLVRRLEQLPSQCLAALQVAACLGAVFALKELAELVGRSVNEVASALWPALEHDLLVPFSQDYQLLHPAISEVDASDFDVRYRFHHDRIQQAADRLLSDSERSNVHRRIGQRLLGREPDPESPQALFEVVGHLNAARNLITGFEQRQQLMVLNRLAGKRALSATAFDAAARYYDAAAACLDVAEWQRQREMAFECTSERVEALLMSGQGERARELCEELRPKAASRTDHARIALHQCRILLASGRLSEALVAVRAGLEGLGVPFPAEPAVIEREIGAGLARMQAHLDRTPIDALQALPSARDPEKIAAMRLLFAAVPPAIMTVPPLFVLAELLMFDLTLTEGLVAESAKNIVDCGMLQGGLLDDYKRAYDLGRAAFAIQEKTGDRMHSCAVHFVFALYVSMWGAPHQEALTAFQNARRLGVESGDHLHLRLFGGSAAALVDPTWVARSQSARPKPSRSQLCLSDWAHTSPGSRCVSSATPCHCCRAWVAMAELRKGRRRLRPLLLGARSGNTNTDNCNSSCTRSSGIGLRLSVGRRRHVKCLRRLRPTSALPSITCVRFC
jgi:predicted ATPase